ncbi:MAG: hypothetical protein WA061_01830 [Microgenomates group bacterium]
MRRNIDNSEDILDSRDIIERIEELESDEDIFEDKVQDLEDEIEDLELTREDSEDKIDELDEEIRELRSQIEKLETDWEDSDEAIELKSLRDFQDEFEGYCPDWNHGTTLIRDSYFVEYAKELANDIGTIDGSEGWPLNCIDWKEAAEELQQDYTSGDFDGVEYWAR